MKSVPPVAFDHRPSRTLIGALVGSFVLANLSIAICGAPISIKAVLHLIASVCFTVSLAKFLRGAPMRAVWQSAGHWRILRRDGIESTMDLSDSFVCGPCILLRLRAQDKSRATIVVAPDNSDFDTRRRLRMRLSRPLPLSRGA